MIIEYVAKKAFKYGDRIIKKGDIFESAGGRWDKQILDPDNGFVFLREANKPPQEAEKPGVMCGKCGRTFSTPQGLAAHSRYCDK